MPPRYSSVEDGNNDARRLYERHGFVTVGRSGDADTWCVSSEDRARSRPSAPGVSSPRTLPR